MKVWIARDKDTNELWAYKHRPLLDVGMYKIDFQLEDTSCYELPKEYFPEITWENSPMEIELKLVEK
jgi:hypothetical protein